jgi:hypothetical protein
MYAVTSLSRFNIRPFTSNMPAANRVLQYLKSHAEFGLHFTSSGHGIRIGIDMGKSIVRDMDSNWANDGTDRKSHGGRVFVASNTSVLWESQKHSFIPMSTVKGAFITCSEASRVVLAMGPGNLQVVRVWIRKTVQCCMTSTEEPEPLHVGRPN